MKKELIDRIIREGIVDTKNYRYICKDYADRREIQRLPVEYIGTTLSLTEWETILVIR